MTTDVIELRGIVKHYRVGDAEVPALREVSLAVPRGRFIAVRGPSGSGKSSLLNVCGLIDAFDAGRYRLEGQDVGSLDETGRSLIRRRRIGFVFQSYNLVPVMTVRENVEYPLLLAGLGEAERRRRVNEILSQVGLADRADRRPDLLSGGQRQRTAIARALVKAPALVIADEPTANLDSATAADLLDIFAAFHQVGVTVVIATHDPQWMARLSPRVLRLERGRLLAA